MGYNHFMKVLYSLCLFLVFVVITSLSFFFTNTNVFASGLEFSVNDYGIQNLTYNGVRFIGPPDTLGYSDSIKYVGGVFRAPGGATSTPSSTEVDIISSSGLNVCPDQNKTNAQCYKHIYRTGLNDSYTVNVELSNYDTRTLLIDTYITNNDSTDTIVEFNIGYWLGFIMHTPDLNPWMYYGDFSTTPVALIPGSWGSMALYTDDYSKDINTYTRNTYDTSGSSTAPTNVGYIWDTNINESIAPGATLHYPLYIRFGSTTDTQLTLAPDALSSFADIYPFTLDWPDRSPIGRWFIAEGNHTSALNPRGYLWDENLDVSNQASFSTAVLNRADSIISLLNTANPRPQGIIIWDLEGEEFRHIFTYVGSPDKLGDLAPEMNAVADQLMEKFRDAGYKVGLTLRPSTFITGTTTPETCTGGEGNGSYNDIFIKNDSPYPRAGYECFSPNVWTQASPRFPNHQTYPRSDAGFLQNLITKVDYAYQRWGTTMFYVDSTVYGDGGNPINSQIWRDLTTYLRTSDTTTYNGVQAKNAKFIFFPENENRDYSAVTAPYNQTDLGGYETSQSIRDIWPNAFSIFAHVSDVYNNLKDATYKDLKEKFHALQPTHDRLVQSIRQGNIFFAEGAWYMNDETVYQLYRDAADNITPNITSFLIQSTSSSLTVPINSFVANDDVAVTAYIITESSTTPALIDPSWDVVATTSYTFSNEGEKTLYAWVRDAGINISLSTSSSVIIKLPPVPSVKPVKSNGGGGGGSLSLNRSLINTISTTAQTKIDVTSLASTTSMNYSFTRNLGVGSVGADVKALQQFLNSQGFIVYPTGSGSPGKETMYFGSGTALALAKFQEKYSSTILTPNGLNKGTGFFGPATIKKVNEIIAESSVIKIVPIVSQEINTIKFSNEIVNDPITTYLYLGTTSPQVKTLQKILNNHGYVIYPTGSGSPGKETTYFGVRTESALKKFQCDKLLICSGSPMTNGYGATGRSTRNILDKINKL